MSESEEEYEVKSSEKKPKFNEIGQEILSGNFAQNFFCAKPPKIKIILKKLNENQEKNKIKSQPLINSFIRHFKKIFSVKT